jgi:hypothetical protein
MRINGYKRPKCAKKTVFCVLGVEDILVLNKYIKNATTTVINTCQKII